MSGIFFNVLKFRNGKTFRTAAVKSSFRDFLIFFKRVFFNPVCIRLFLCNVYNCCPDLLDDDDDESEFETSDSEYDNTESASEATIELQPQHENATYNDYDINGHRVKPPDGEDGLNTDTIVADNENPEIDPAAADNVAEKKPCCTICCYKCRKGCKKFRRRVKRFWRQCWPLRKVRKAWRRFK
jgi:hypothetical protein